MKYLLLLSLTLVGCASEVQHNITIKHLDGLQEDVDKMRNELWIMHQTVDRIETDTMMIRGRSERR